LSRVSVRCLAALIGTSLFASISLGASSAPSVLVETAPLQKCKLRDAVAAYGTVAASEESMVDVSFPHPGQIMELHVRAGQKVRDGDPLVTITADPAALQSYEKARAALEFAKRELSRQETLRKQHLATNAQVATAQIAVTDATVALETERKLGNDQRTALAAAPADGYVSQVMAALGDRLSANTAIMKLARTDKGLRIVAGLAPEDASRVVPGMAAEVTPIFSAGLQPVEGTVRQISGTINAMTKLVDAWIDVMQTTKLIPGVSVSVIIVLSQHEAWVVPRNAVLHDEDGSYLFQVTNGQAKRVDVKTGIETDQLTEVSGGFDPMLQVVTAGNYELRDGMAVREASPATNP
jgi:membrane fusion protein, multidrug efflux system